MSVNYTESQREAIENRGGALLVAAAAGSGKTKVLVERLLKSVTDQSNPVDIDRFLIITYTKAAAAELRSRILDEINERLSAEPENRQLRRQLPLVYKAPISTIHSFCSSVLRENAQLLKISPDFRVMESDESDMLMQKALEDVLDSRYEKPDSDFLLLIDTMAAGRDDSKLPPLVMEFYSKLKSHPYPEKWANEKLKEMEESVKASDVSETPWGKIVLSQAKSTTDYWLEVFEDTVKSLSCDAAMCAAYHDSFIETESSLKRFRNALNESWDKARAALPIEFKKLKPLRGALPEADEAKRVREDCKKAMSKLCETFDSSSIELLEDLEAVIPAVRALVSLTLDFDRACTDEKTRRKTLDFGDLEHLALRLLVDDNGNPSKKAQELSMRYAEIMVDEYQDANEIQDLLINAVSRSGENVFMVGDVKQSIYRFRLADPTIFLRKYMTFKNACDAAPKEPRKIVLQENFRSRSSVLDAVNFVFSNIMSKEFGEMDYGENECLKLGNIGFPENANDAFEFNLIEIPEAEDEEAPDKTETEAAFVAQRIKSLVDGGMLVTEKDGRQRRLTYCDIAILLRGVKGKAKRYAEALRIRNIPVSAENSGGFWEKTEICVMVSLLSVIDNPRQDVPLISALRSPLFGFTPDELAEIRATDKNSDFYSALKKASEKSENCINFIKFLEEMRLSASDMPVDALIWRIYSETSAMAVFGAMSGGLERKNNLMALFDMARQFESVGYKGLFDFVANLDKLMKRGGEVSVQSSKATGNAVTITSIHKSKGLEYPVVILAGTGTQFNKDDVRRPLLLHTELGAGPKRLDLKRRIEYTTLPRMAIAKRMTDEMLAEELRVLYVAMTRAREKLIVTYASKNMESKLEKLRRSAKAPIAPQVLSSCASMGEWLILTALLRKEASAINGTDAALLYESLDSLWDIRRITPECAAETKEEETLVETTEEAPEAELKEIERALNFSYTHEVAVSLPSKLTATGIKGRFLDKEAAEEAEKLDKPKEKHVFERPNFAKEETALTAAERGVALHLVMQYIDFDKCYSIEGVSCEIKRMAELKIISEKQAKAVSPDKILKFFDSALGKEIRQADALLREFKFSLLTPASDYFTEGEGEEILLQGVVDCCLEKDEELTVIDFKTDYVTEENQKEKAESYRIQLETYAKAMERITGKKVTRKLLYFFRTDSAVEL